MDVSPYVIERQWAKGPSQTEAYADGIAGQCRFGRYGSFAKP
jgi:hypothetical protein